MTISLPDLFDALLSELNPAACLRDISAFWNFRSTVPGPGLRQASEFLASRHRQNGLEVDLHAYPADGETASLDGHANPFAWVPHSASLEVLTPGEKATLICSYAREPLCLISNSTATPPEGLVAEVVILHSGTQPEDYAGIDVAGKIIFTDVWPLLVDEQARLRGAVGIITDSVTPPWLFNYPPVRRPADVPDLTMWGILNGHPGKSSLWGFSLSPRQGENLRRLLRESETTVLLRARVDAELVPGTSEVVDACLPGFDPQEIWVLSHSSEPGALDNASGCCLSLEIARVLKTLITSGRLPPPRRSIRFLNAVETEGYFPFVHAWKQEGRLSRVAAALALDSIGSDFRQSGGSLRLFRSPIYNPSYADGLASELVRAAAALPNERFTSDPYDIFPWQVDPFFPGNDNFLADGYFDIPTPMLCNWPDKHYHSNLDTADKLSSNSLGRAGLAAAAYLYLLAAAGPEDAGWLAGRVLKDYKERILQSPSIQLSWQGAEALASLARLIPQAAAKFPAWCAELETFAHREIASASSLAGEAPSAAVDPQPVWEGRDFIPTPLRWHVMIENLTPRDSEVISALRADHPALDQVWNLLNGRRSAAAVAKILGLPSPALKRWLAVFHNQGWIARPDLRVDILHDSELDPSLRSDIDRMVRSVFMEGYDSMLWAPCAGYVLVRVDGDLACHISISLLTIQIGDRILRLGGVGGVATLPQYRGQGLAALAMHRAAAALREPFGVDFGLLFCSPELASFYAGLGWQPVVDPVTYDQPDRKIQNDGPVMYLPCRQTDWPPGRIDLNSYPW